MKDHDFLKSIALLMRIKRVFLAIFLLNLVSLSVYAEASLYSAYVSTPSCKGIFSNSEAIERLKGRIRHPDRKPPLAIFEILYVLKNLSLSGEQKLSLWLKMVHFYNQNNLNRSNWIASPCIGAVGGASVCWGDIRGHLLIFREDGMIFKSFNPQRSQPRSNNDGLYEIDWSDETIKPILPDS